MRFWTVTVLLITADAERMFKKDSKTPAEIRKAKLEEWYSELEDQSKLKLSRYLDGVKVSSPYDFFTDTINKAIADENCQFAVRLCEEAYANVDMTDYERFKINELLIVAYCECDRNDDAKVACETNYDLFPKIREELIKENGGIPETLQFRNQYINVIVGIESNYDLGFEMLKRYNEMGILSDEDLEYRTNSLRTHRLQKVFDGVYTYRPKGEDL